MDDVIGRLGREVNYLASVSDEQLAADRRRYLREISTWKQRANLTEEHPNIAKRRARIRVIDQLLERRAANLRTT